MSFVPAKAELPRAVVAAVNELADCTLADVAATLCMAKCVTPTEEEWASEVTMPALIFPTEPFQSNDFETAEKHRDAFKGRGTRITNNNYFGTAQSSTGLGVLLKAR